MRSEQLAGLLLAGGKSRRIEQPKPLLHTTTGKTFLETAQQTLSSFSPLLLSVERSGLYDSTGFVEVPDLVPDSGPLGALVSALKAIESTDKEGVFVLACDMPNCSPALVDCLTSIAAPSSDVTVAKDRSGRIHPLCGIYCKTALPTLEAMLQEGNLRMMEALQRLSVTVLPLEYTIFPDEQLTNINTIEAYRQYRHFPIPVVAISGIKNSGKTTFLRRLLPELASAGIQAGVIKHDGHDFEPDVPHTDSYMLREAGASRVAVFSQAHTLFAQNRGVASETELFPAFEGLDLILLEGFKYSDYPKIEVVRREISNAPVGKPETLIGVATDTDWSHPEIPVFSIQDVQTACKLILAFLKKEYGR